MSLLSSDQPSGWVVPPGESKVARSPHGVDLQWDNGVPYNEERLETLLVIAATEPQDFGLLTTATEVRSRENVSPLESLLEEARSGQRGWPAGPADPTSGYQVEATDFFWFRAGNPVSTSPRLR